MTVETNSPRRFRWTPGLVAGLTLMGLLVIVGILAPLFLSSSAETLSRDVLLPPSLSHPLGTDDFGRDILARSLVATRLTLVMTVAATLISVVLGIAIGTATWLAPRPVRESVLRVIEALVAYPSMIFALLIAAILGPGIMSAVVSIGLAGVPSFSRLTANLAASISHREFVSTSRLLGVSGLRIATRHMLPNMAEPLLILSATSFAVTLVEISSLSFVGLGVQSPDYDFGRLLNEGIVAIYTRPLQALAPATMIVIAGLSAILIGDGLAAAANPRSTQRFRLSRKAASELQQDHRDDSDAVLKVKDLRVSSRVSGAPLVKGISFSIARGETVGLVGESGSGKSLTAMSIAGLLGEDLLREASVLRLGDLNLVRGSADQAKLLATELGLVYQDPGTTFNPALRMGTQLTEVARVHRGASKARSHEELIRSLEEVHITLPEKRMRQYSHELSGGMLQRSMIAGVLSNSPSLIIADEATTALDVTVQAQVLRQFRRISRQYGTAMLFISHDIGVVQALCDRVLVMNAGVILEEVTGKDLAAGRVTHPYTRALLAASPSLTTRKEELTTIRWTPEASEDEGATNDR